MIQMSKQRFHDYGQDKVICLRLSMIYFPRPALINYPFSDSIYAEAGLNIKNGDLPYALMDGAVIPSGQSRLGQSPGSGTIRLMNTIRSISRSRNNALFLKFNVPIGAAKKKGSKDEQ